MGRASKNFHHSSLAGVKNETRTMPKSTGNKGLPMVGTPNPINPPAKDNPSIPTGRKNLKKY